MRIPDQTTVPFRPNRSGARSVKPPHGYTNQEHARPSPHTFGPIRSLRHQAPRISGPFRIHTLNPRIFRQIKSSIQPPSRARFLANQDARRARNESAGDRQPGVVPSCDGGCGQLASGAFVTVGPGTEAFPYPHREPSTVPGKEGDAGSGEGTGRGAGEGGSGWRGAGGGEGMERWRGGEAERGRAERFLAQLLNLHADGLLALLFFLACLTDLLFSCSPSCPLVISLLICLFTLAHFLLALHACLAPCSFACPWLLIFLRDSIILFCLPALLAHTLAQLLARSLDGRLSD